MMMLVLLGGAVQLKNVLGKQALLLRPDCSAAGPRPAAAAITAAICWFHSNMLCGCHMCGTLLPKCH